MATTSPVTSSSSTSASRTSSSPTASRASSAGAAARPPAGAPRRWAGLQRAGRRAGQLTVVGALAAGGVLVPGGWSPVAGAADGRCVEATALEPAPGTGTVIDVPATVDATGTREVSSELQALIAGLPDGTTAAPTVLRFAPGGTYWVDYPLVLAKRGSGGIAGAAWPELAPFRRVHVVLDFQGATLAQRSSAAYQAGGPGVPAIEPRKRWGAPLIYTGGASDVELRNGTLWGANQNGHYSAAREPWAGVYVTGDPAVGADRVWIHDLTIRNPWGDFVYIAAKAHTLTRVVVERNVMRAAGRQGVVVNGGDGVTIANNAIWNVDRFVFDSEPTATGGWNNLVISGNSGNSGGLGYFQYAAPSGSQGSRLGIIGNTISTGNLRIRVGGSPDRVRSCAVIAYNRNAGTRQFQDSLAWPQLMRVGAWTNVVVRKNYDQVYPDGTIRALSTELATDVDAAQNCFAGAVDDTCAEPDVTGPSTPTVTVADAAAARVTLTWPAAVDPSGVSGYRVYRNAALVGTVGTPGYTDAGLAPLTGYIYQVEAIDYWGNPSAKGFVGVTTPADTTAPSAPGIPTGTATAPDTVRLEWTGATDDVKVVGYRVYRDGVVVATVTGLARTLAGLTPGTEYRFALAALDLAGNESPRSAELTLATPPDTTAPSAPGAPSATRVALGSVTVRWTAASDDVQVGAYRVYADGVLVATTGPGGRAATVKGLTPGRAYVFTVGAVDTSGNAGPLAGPATATA